MSTLIATNFVHPLKARSPIVVTELGIVMEFSLRQKEKAKLPIYLTESGMFT